MDQVISAQLIEATETFKNASNMQKGFLVKRASREVISHSLIVYRNTKYVDESIGDKNLSVLKELIFKEFGVEPD